MSAFALAASDDFDQAIREEAMFNYGKLQYELGGGIFNEAITTLDNYIKEFPDSPRINEAREILLAAYFNSRNYNAAYEAKIPVIFNAVSDPVAAKLAESDTQAMDGITGVSDMLPVDEQLKLIREMLTVAKKIVILYTTSVANSVSTKESYKEKVGEYGFELVEKGITNAAEIPQAVDLLVSEVDCISNMTDNTVVENLPILLEKATAKNIPVFGSEEEQVGNGCIASAGIDYIELGKKAGIMAARVLKGEDIKNIPYETLTESKITINTDAAEKIGVTIPQSITDRAEVKNAPSES